MIGFLLSPLGVIGLVFAASASLALLLIKYAALIVTADLALREVAISLRQVVATVVRGLAHVFALALVQTCLAIALAAPFAGLAALVYWWLLSGTDINFYLTERPARFWLAAAIGVLLVIGLVVSAIWLFLRWVLALPGCVLAGQSWREAMRHSATLVRGRGLRLLAVLGTWQLAKYVAYVVVMAGLDQTNHLLLRGFGERLAMLVWSTVLLLLVDAIVLQLLGATFEIGLALILAHEYRLACLAHGEKPITLREETQQSAQAVGRSWPIVATAGALLVAGPLASMKYALALAEEFVEHRLTQVTAHRAGSKAAPENSLVALRRSLAAGADYVEIDVQQTADGQVILMHDRDLRRVTGDPREPNLMPLAELAPLRLRWQGAATEETIPTLAQFLAACDERIRLNVEMKDFGRTPQLGQAVATVLDENGFLDRARVSSFAMAPLLGAQAAQPHLPIGIILATAQGDITRLPVEFLSLNERLVRGDLVRRAHARGQAVHVWTVNDRESALRLLDLGCDNLITSDPAPLRELVDWYAGLDDTERMLLRLRAGCA